MKTFLEILNEWILTKNNNNPQLEIKSKRFENDNSVQPFKIVLSELKKFVKNHKNSKTNKFEPSQWSFSLFDIEKGILVPYQWGNIVKLFNERDKLSL